MQETAHSLLQALARPLGPVRQAVREKLFQKRDLRRHYLRTDFPYVYGISLGRTVCNLRCRMCPMYNAPPKQNTFITDEIMERALDPIGDRDVSLEISAFGEPLQHPRALDYLDQARRKATKAHIVFVSNGLLLTEERAQRVVNSGVDVIQISIDAGSPETYQWLTGSSAYDRVCRNVERLVEMRDRQNATHLTIQAHIIGIKELEHEFQAFIDRWSGVVDHANIRAYGNWGGKVDENGLSQAERQETPKERYPCLWLWYSTKIEPNGDVVKCHIHTVGHDEDRLGSLLEQDFHDIWRGEVMRQARALHLEGRGDQLMHCGTCNIWSLFPNIWEKRRPTADDPRRWE